MGSCDNIELLKSMLGGSYSISDIGLGNNANPDFIYNENIDVEYFLETKQNLFNIKHKGAFINTSHTRIIPIQINGTITKEDIKSINC